MLLIDNKKFLMYLLKFAGVFCILYFGTLAVIGLSTPGGYYNSYIERLNFIDWLRKSLLYGSKALLGLFGFKTEVEGLYILRAKHGGAVRMVYQCIGYGVMSFWAAFVFANTATISKKLKWILGGWILVWCINVIRVSLLLAAINNKWSMPVKIEHHTIFNIVAYTLILVMIYFFDRSQFRVFSKPKTTIDL